jgi:hypothetical protein
VVKIIYLTKNCFLAGIQCTHAYTWIRHWMVPHIIFDISLFVIIYIKHIFVLVRNLVVIILRSQICVSNGTNLSWVEMLVTGPPETKF